MQTEKSIYEIIKEEEWLRHGIEYFTDVQIQHINDYLRTLSTVNGS